ncbi:MAG: hypothetical protein CVT63_07725 [Candidatus Anoxymicrobium japonicum]|uniref:Calcineurin-like phosphoesterase domain-containing protein n=1 Tax=Candidatus Anoxymicrobium japonicum TaxID=2013648 RepID=A0A2N3G440_9ACTN|nr:MAG: hypothetical protein CVT63_07725 [Candidatus Anoxymicrobium japonicum]
MTKPNSSERNGKIIAISDTHFGDKSQLLNDERLVDRFMEVLSGRGAIAELILLGDIVDLWMKTLVPALKHARYFFHSLSLLENVEKVMYIPGNHDHQMFLDAFRLEIDVRVMQGNLTVPKFMPARSYGDTILSGLAHPGSRIHFPMTYPFVSRRVNGKDVIFTHGHHLDFYATSYGWARTFWLGRYIIRRRRKKASLHDIEMANIPFCGAMSMWPWVPELVNEGLRFYHVISFFERLLHSNRLRESPLRDSLVKESYKEIEQLLPQLGHPHPAGFIFGHTHRPGLGKLPDADTTIANTGSWTRSPDKSIPVKTWIEVDNDIKLFKLGREGPELLNSAAL